MMRLRLLCCIIFSVCVPGCRSSDPTPPLVLPPGSARGLYVVNEGGFSGGGGVSFYDSQRDTVYQNAVAGSDDWVFPNDMMIVGAKAYVTVNGSDRIDVIDMPRQAVVGSIPFPMFSGPGFMAASGETLFVANYDGSISLVKLGADSLIATIPGVVGFPGGIACHAGKVFVSDIGLYPTAGSVVKVLYPGNPGRFDSVHVENAPGQLVELGGGLFVVCTGTSRVYRFDTESLALTDSLQLGAYVSDCATDGEFLYLLGSDGVAKLEDNPLTIIHSSLIRRSAGSYFYALFVSKPAGIIYVSNIMSPGGVGRVESYRVDGSERRQPFAVGIFPGAFALKE